MFLAVKKEGMATVTQTISEDFGFGAATSLVIGLFVLGTIISPDIARWAKSKKDAILAAFFGFLIGNSFMLVMAIIILLLVPKRKKQCLYIIPFSVVGFFALVTVLS